MKKTLLILLCILSIGHVKAYENEYFKIDIPSNYKEEKLEENAFKWDYGNKYYAITLADNTEKQYNVRSFTKYSIEKQKEYLENSLNNGLKEYDIKVSVTDIKKSHDDNYYFLEYHLLFPSTEKTGHNIYQIGRMYTTEHLITTITYSSDSEIDENNEEYINVMNSLKILDDNITFKKVDAKTYFTTIIILGAVLGIIGYVRSNKKHK